VAGGLPAASLRRAAHQLAARRERLPRSTLNCMLKFWFYGQAEDLRAQVLALARWVWRSTEHRKALH